MTTRELSEAQFYFANGLAKRCVALQVQLPSLGVKPISKLSQRELTAQVPGEALLYVLKVRLGHGS
jgi:hypothetical protein